MAQSMISVGPLAALPLADWAFLLALGAAFGAMGPVIDERPEVQAPAAPALSQKDDPPPPASNPDLPDPGPDPVQKTGSGR